ncbi:hypothetical protein MCT03_05360 [Vibrio aestuarianus]|nr:hypothetical protein [Vibrio aestuarianus]
MMSISKRVLLFLISGTLLLLSEHVFGLNYAAVFIVFLATAYFYLSNKLKESLFLILLFSALSQGGLNVFTFSIAGLNLFYFLILTLLFISVFTKRKQLFTLSRVSFTYLLLVFFVLTYSIFNFYSSPLFFVKDFIVIVFLPIAFFVLFKKIENRDILFVIYNIIAIKVIVSLVFYLTGLTLHVEDNLHGAMVVDNADELGAFFHTLLLSFILFVKNKNKSWMYLIFIISIAGMFFLWSRFFRTRITGYPNATVSFWIICS